MKEIFKLSGLHPLIAIALISIDWMLFGGEVATAGVSLFLTIPIAIFLTIATILIQKFLYKDSWAIAWGKAIVAGILTAIPTALPSFITLGGGVLGSVGMYLSDLDKTEKKQDIESKSSSNEIDKQ